MGGMRGGIAVVAEGGVAVVELAAALGLVSAAWSNICSNPRMLS